MKTRLIFFCISILFIASIPFEVNAAEVKGSKTDKEISTLKKEMQELKNEIQEIKKELEDIKTKSVVGRPVPPQEPQEVMVSIDDDPLKGDINAPVTIIEFSDYQCPFCGRFFKSTLSEIEKKYIESGKVKYIFRDFPLEFHKYAPKASEAANCAGEKGKYWEMHDKLFNNQNALEVDKLKQYATEIGLDSVFFDACIDSGKYEEEIKRDIDEGKKVAVGGTPTFFIGKTQSNKKEIVGTKLVGARPFSAFEQMIEQLLAEQAK